MRLAAIWIEDYMKIKNQGFNFGGRYTYNFNFNNEIRTLSINAVDTPDHYNLFSNSEIINISGIIGINGSGKSSLLKLINVIAAEKPLINSVVVIIENEEENSYEIIDYVSTFFHFGKKQAINISLPKKGIFSEENGKKDNT